MRLLAVVLIATGIMFIGAQTAAADTPGCVSRGEFSRVRDGMTSSRVHRVFDTSGRLVSVHIVGNLRHESRTYRACRPSRRSHVSVQYTNGKVTGKFRF
jgi:hypothetical protein